jgi:flagellar basal-body rod modification protein FlgD
MTISTIGLQQTLSTLKNQTSQVNFQSGQSKLGNSNIDKAGFFQLMLAQMSQQNPLEPTDSSQQMMQQAQFTQIEELQKLNANMTQNNLMSQGSNYVGKDITYTLNGQTKTGRVTKVTFGTDSIGLSVNGDTITPSQVTELRAPTTP